MRTSRLEAFSDGVMAIIVTIMVLELRAPVAEGAQTASFQDLVDAHLGPVVLSYLLSFVFVAIYWNNHHHVMATVERVTSGIMWANMALLFCLSLLPFATNWLGENVPDAAPAALYGMVCMACGLAYYTLEQTIIRSQGTASLLGEAVGSDLKGIVSLVCYAVAIPAAFVSAWISYALFVAVAVMWFVPDRRIAGRLASAPERDVDAE
jgi:uncharacterized membrane protein